MFRTPIVALVAGLALATAASAQTTGWRYRWSSGQVLTYRVEHVTSSLETLDKEKPTETRSHLTLTKRWQVLEVDRAGIATLQLTLASLRMETKLPNGDTLLFDSADPGKSTPQLKDQLTKYVGPPLALLRLDRQGQVVEIKESNFGPKSKFEAELPFSLILPDRLPQVGQGWERAYLVTLEPPQGTGEKYDAVQRYTCKAAAEGTATIALATTFKALPEANGDRIPLLQFQPEGEIVFDTQAGLVRSAHLRIDKVLSEHQGPGTSYHFQSDYTEQYAGGR